MSFMDSLALNPSNSSSGVYGMPKPQSDNDVLSIVNQMKDREMQDYKNKAEFDDDRQIRQQLRMRSMFPPEKLNPQDMPHTAPQMMMSPEQETDQKLRLQQPGIDLEKQKLAQSGKLGQEGLDIKTAQEKLNQQKSDQINAEKQKELQAKIDEANKKITLSQQALTDKEADITKQLQAHKDMAAAVEERHKLELENKQHQFDVTSSQHQKQIDDLEKRVKDQEHTSTTTELDPSGNKKTVTTKKGDSVPRPAPVKNPNGTYHVHGPDGFESDIPADKLDDWMENHQNIPDSPKPGRGE